MAVRVPSLGHRKPGNLDKGVDMQPLRRWERAIRRRVDRGLLPGYCSCVIQRGAVIHADAYGYADIEQKREYGPRTILRLYCLTKPVIGVAVLILKERGLLSLHDPISKYLPKFERQGVVSRGNAVFKKVRMSAKRKRDVTILRLLTHTAGLGYGPDFGFAPNSPAQAAFHGLTEDVQHGRVRSLAEFCDRLAALPLRSEPGKAYSYSYGLDVLGRVVEVVSGMHLDRFLEREIFQPLGMKDTGFSVPRHKLNRLAALYVGQARAEALGEGPRPLPRRSGALVRVDGRRPAESRWAKGNASPVLSGGGLMGHNMGGLVSTLADQARFVAMLLGRGRLDGRRILKETTVERYCLEDLLPQAVPQKQFQGGKYFGWNALGEVGLRRTGRETRGPDDFEEGEVGMGGAACVYWSLSPARDMAVLWATQNVDNECWESPAENLWVAARAAVPKRPPPASKARDSCKRVGTTKRSQTTSKAAPRKGVRRTVRK